MKKFLGIISLALVLIVVFTACSPSLIIYENHYFKGNDLLVDVMTAESSNITVTLCDDNVCVWHDTLNSAGACELFPDLPDRQYQLVIEAVSENRTEMQIYEIRRTK